MLNLSLIPRDILPDPEKNKGVRFCRSDFAEHLLNWAMVDLCLGTKAKLLREGTLILPKPSNDKRDPDLDKRYDSYQQRAVWFGVTRRTLRGLVGEVFANPPTVQGIEGSQLDDMLLDVDGSGVTLEQQASATMTLSIAFGRCGLLTDYPKANDITSHADVLSGKIKPIILRIEPQNIRNWRTRFIGSKNMLTMVVIYENAEKSDDGFKAEYKPQWRVLRLEQIDNVWTYIVQLYQLDDNGNEVIIDTILPTKPDGKVFNEIPFKFVGPETNEADINDAPLYDMAELNIAHFRNSADYEECLFFAGQVTPVFSGFTPEYIAAVKEWKDGTVVIGSRAAVLLPANGTAELLQASANSMPMEGMLHKESQMRALGAKLVENVSTTKTATQDVRESSQDSSVLASCARNVSAAMTDCLKWACDFIGMDSANIEYELSDSFTTSRMSYQDRMQLMKEWQGGGITWEEYRFKLKQDNIAYETDEKAKANIAKDKAAEMQLVADNTPDPTVGTVPKAGANDPGATE